MKNTLSILFAMLVVSVAYAQPANNTMATAITIANTSNYSSTNAQYTNVAATADGTATTCIAINKNVWFKFQATTTEIEAKVLRGGAYGTIAWVNLGLYDNSGAPISCQYQNASLSVASTSLTIGNWYYISVDSWSGYEGTFTLTVNNSVSNDSFVKPFVITNTAGYVSADAAFTNANATADKASGGCGLNKNLWFKFQATTSEIDIKIDAGGTKGTIAGHYLTVYDASFNAIACQAPSGYLTTAFYQSTTMTVGAWYYFSVDNNPLFSSGSFTVSVNNVLGYDLRSKATTLTHSASNMSADAAYSNTTATPDGTSTSCNPALRNVWFKFQATTTELEAKVFVGGTKGTMQYAHLALYDNAGTPMLCKKSTTTNVAYVQSVSLTVGNWYYLSVDNTSGAVWGTFTLFLANTVGFDLRDKALLIANTNGWNTADAAYTTVGSTGDGAPSSCMATVNQNVWFKFQATSVDIEIKLQSGGTKGTIAYPALTLSDAAGTVLACIQNDASNVAIQYTGLAIGSWYYFSVDAYSAAGTFTLRVNNAFDFDRRANAIVLANTNSFISSDAQYSNVNSSPDGTTPITSCMPAARRNVWFKFQAATTDIEVKVFNGASKGTITWPVINLQDEAGSNLGCGNNGSTNPWLQLSNLVVGSWYYISIDNANTGIWGTFTMSVTNNVGYDFRDRATNIAVNNYVSADAAFNNTTATPDAQSASCGTRSKNVWFKFQAPNKNQTTIRILSGTTKGTIGGAFVGLFTDAGTQLACATTTSGVAQIQFVPTTGSWYYFSVDGTAAGSFTLEANNGAGALFSAFAFQYKYDGRQRMIAKKVPGADWVYMVYDNRDRLVLTQDGNQRTSNLWSFTKYDVLNRPIMTGIWSYGSAKTQAQMQTEVDAFYSGGGAWGETLTGTIHGYTNVSYPNISNPNNYLSVTYYDSYDFKTLNPNGTRLDFLSTDLAGQTIDYITRLYGMTTGTKIKVLDGGTWGGPTWLASATYYDERLRVIQTVMDNYKGGMDRMTSIVDFTGRVMKTKTTHSQFDPGWRNLVGVKLVGNKVTKTDATASWGAGVSSFESMAAGVNGWVESTYTTAASAVGIFGLNDYSPDASYPSMEYAVKFSGSLIEVTELGVTKFTQPSFLTEGDVIRIERNGTTVTYKKNGTVFYTSLTASNTVLLADVSLYAPGTTLYNIKTSFSGVTHSVVRRMQYDQQGRLLKTYHQLDSDPEILLSSNQYNELGQLVDKSIHSKNGTTFEQSLDTRYNIRGWLTSVNNATLSLDPSDNAKDLFGFELLYNIQNTGIGNTSLFNGNISAMAWSANYGLGPVKSRSYKYSYDELNRIKTADYKESGNGTIWTVPTITPDFSESAYTYDLNGNIKTLIRKGEGGVIDNLSYNYGSGPTLSNQLISVTDAGNVQKGFVDLVVGSADYTYDVNGNMNKDENKGLTGANAITYNFLNLPEVVTKGAESIQYIYDASGRKITQVTNYATRQKVSDYMGEYFYENDTLKFINTEEGRIVVKGVSSVSAMGNWPLDGNGIDQGGNNLNGVVYGGAGATTNRKGLGSAAILMDGADDYIGISDNPYFNFGANDFTISFWVNKLAGNVNWDNSAGLGKWNSSASPGTNGWNISLGTTAGGNLPGASIEVGTTTYSVLATTSLVIGQWYQLTCQRSGTSLKFYVNGVLEGTTTIPATASINSPSLPVSIGKLPGLFTNASFDDIKITRQLTTTSSVQEYQYHLKDHLGNTRLSFTTVPERDINYATMETANAGAESGKFLYYTEAVKINTPLFDHTAQGTTFYSTRLNGSTNERTGLAKSIAVMPGDTINTEVFVKYLDPTSSNWTTVLQNLMTSIANNTAPAGTLIDGGAAGSTGGVTAPFQSVVSKGAETGTSPKAYLNYLVFDKYYNFVDGGFLRVSTAAREYGQDGPHEKLSKQLVVTQPGYVYLYLSNDNVALGGAQIEVYFDDFKVEHIKSKVIQTDDYYPFGLRFNSFSRESAVPNKSKLFQNQEHIDDLGLNWDSFKWRNHQPEIGRFFGIDKLAEKYYYNSPYAFSENRVIDGRELEGLEWESVKNSDGTTTRRLTIQLVNQANFSDKKIDRLIAKMQKNFAKTFSNSAAKAELNVVKSNESGAFGVTLRATTSNQVFDPVTRQPSGKIIEGGKTDQLGGVLKNGIKISASTDGHARSLSSITRSFMHEAGHSAGLEHPWSKGNTVTDITSVSSNLMNSDQNPNASQRSSTGTKLTQGQFSLMDQKISSAHGPVPDDPDSMKYNHQ